MILYSIFSHNISKMLEDVISQSTINKFDSTQEKWKKTEVFYTKVKGLTYMSITNNKIHKRQIEFLQNEIAKREEKMELLKKQKDELSIRNYRFQKIIEYLEKKINKLKSREENYKRINSISNPTERIQALTDYSNQIYKKLQNKAKKFSFPKISKQINLDTKNTLVLNKNGTYFYYPDDVDTFYQNARLLFLSFLNEPQRNDSQKISELLYQFDFNEDEIATIIQKYHSNL
ncbi:hypothetical protein TRFO_05370 [Tritrichomonas foetus]|uniref:Uncharacterized protein n=1 Tax=Tritrichomonas foetus TaxID=1144522 RepID=A0A1J4KB76_9EUKA|nr:hypothetical protein TRFO_05370 [Tritrichomonas foetus]|eukprot:OHT06717.1 hypothetical protein TRFO_05370 [Tritrichomonas foetus]